MASELDAAFDNMILSASGWRGIFAENADEKSSGPDISFAHKLFVAAAAMVFSDFLNDRKGPIVVGRDTRPTGPAITDAVIRSLLASGRELLFSGIVAAPEIMAYAKISNAAGFIYISASHNPIGHNGLKFGLNDGGVLQSDDAAKLLLMLKAFAAEAGAAKRVEKILKSGEDEKLFHVYAGESACKKAAMEAYRDFTSGVISGFNDKKKSEYFFAALRNNIDKKPIGIAADFNGSARAASIDKDFFVSLGVKFNSLNEVPGQIVHSILPEGNSLESCRNFLEELHRKDPSFVLGYMPDCDGDRGNLVFFDEKERKSKIPEAQEVFALACVAELTSMVRFGLIKYDTSESILSKTAIVVNDPTSYRIDKIAKAFGANVFRAEVGEANLVGLSRKLREEGFLVRIQGEGTSGGTIIHPSAVRDPINTVAAILKLLTIRSDDDGMGLFEIWCRFSGCAEKYRDNFSLTDIINSLPAFVTTETHNENALLKIKTSDHGLLKDRYQEIFLRDWEQKKEMFLKEFSINTWDAITYNGIIERRGIKRFGEAGRGGLKIEFSGNTETIASIWMRGSGTEPVFRIIADAPSRALEQFLIKWQRDMVLEADNK